MNIIYEFGLVYNEFNLPSVCATNQHFIDDDFIGCPDDYANLTDAIFSTSLFEEKLVCIFLLDEENEVHGVFRIEYFEGINLQSVCQDIFTKILSTGFKKYVFVQRDPEWNWKITSKDEKMFIHLSKIGRVLNIQMMCYIFFGNGGIDYI